MLKVIVKVCYILETENLFLLVKNKENVLNPRVLKTKKKKKRKKRMLLLPKLSTEIKVIYFELLRLGGHENT